MSDLSESDSEYRASEAKNTGKGRLVICKTSKQWFLAFEKLTHRPSDGMDSMDRDSRRGWPISREVIETYKN